MLTFRLRPPRSRPSIAFTAAWASASLPISTNANPRGRPVSRSMIRATDCTVPCAEKALRTSSSLLWNDRLPTYSLFSDIEKKPRSCPTFREAPQRGGLARPGDLLPCCCPSLNASAKQGLDERLSPSEASGLKPDRGNLPQNRGL